jgi:photosystem II stability/assembly factor-like uncharacterized protein
VTNDGGATWTPIKGLTGFRSVVAYMPSSGKRAIAVGPAGSDYSEDGGTTWKPIAGPGFHTFSIARQGKVGFGAGEKGAVGRLTW